MILRRILIVATPILIIVLGAVGIGVMGSLKPEPEKKEEVSKGLAVFVEEARSDNLTLTVRTQGEVTPRREISLVPQVGGRIDYVNPSFIEGGFFEAGETLVRVEQADYQLAVTRARAEVARAEQRLVREQAEAELAREEWAEIGEGLASPLTLREPQMAEAQANLEAAKASLRDAELALSRTNIRAPFDGRVRTKMVDVGQFVSPGQNIGEVFSTDKVQVRLPLTNAELALLELPLAFEANDDNPGPQVRFSADVAGQVRDWEGRIVRTDSAIDPQTRVLFAIAEVDDPYGAAADNGTPLAVGLFVDAAIEGRAVQNAVVIPRAGLRNRRDVFVATDEDTLEIRQATVIDASPETAILAGGVQPGERIVVSPIQTPSDGMKLNPLTVEDEERGAAAAIAAAEIGDQS